MEENVDSVFVDDSLIQKEIKTEIKEEYVEPVKIATKTKTKQKEDIS